MADTVQHAPLTRALADFIGTFSADALPGEVADMTLLSVRDGAGAFKGGWGRFWGRVDVVAGTPVAPTAVEADDLRERVRALRGSRR